MLLPSPKPVTVVFFKNMSTNSCALVHSLQFGDNWLLTSTHDHASTLVLKEQYE